MTSNPWFGDPEGHRRAALLGWERRRGSIPRTQRKTVANTLYGGTYQEEHDTRMFDVLRGKNWVGIGKVRTSVGTYPMHVRPYLPTGVQIQIDGGKGQEKYRLNFPHGRKMRLEDVARETQEFIDEKWQPRHKPIRVDVKWAEENQSHNPTPGRCPACGSSIAVLSYNPFRCSYCDSLIGVKA